VQCTKDRTAAAATPWFVRPAGAPIVTATR